MSTIYDQDLVLWAQEQARLLREGKLDQADVENIAEEIESLGKNDKRELLNRLKELLMHLLKWTYQPERRTVSWATSVVKQRTGIDVLLEDSPSLRPRAIEVMPRAYGLARKLAAIETGLGTAAFPAECPWTFDEAMTAQMTLNDRE